MPTRRPNTMQYLKLSDFDSKLAGQLNYYVLGSLFGLGKKKRAAQHDIWQDLRSLAYFGICDCERKLTHFDSAIALLPEVAHLRRSKTRTRIMRWGCPMSTGQWRLMRPPIWIRL